MSEAHIVINGITLAPGQEMALRVACTDYLMEMEQPDALGEDEHGRAMALGYAERLREVLGFIIHVQQMEGLVNRDLKFFLLGFFASREGFNGECAFPHLARSSIFSGSCFCEFSDLAEFNPAGNKVDTELNRLFGDAQGLVGDDKREPNEQPDSI